MRFMDRRDGCVVAVTLNMLTMGQLNNAYDS